MVNENQKDLWKLKIFPYNNEAYIKVLCEPYRKTNWIGTHEAENWMEFQVHAVNGGEQQVFDIRSNLPLLFLNEISICKAMPFRCRF